MYNFKSEEIDSLFTSEPSHMNHDLLLAGGGGGGGGVLLNCSLDVAGIYRQKYIVTAGLANGFYILD